jgi:flagellar biosynthesis/type III secretory pathway chaperone
MISSAPQSEAETFSEALAFLEAACQHFFEALRSERRALQARRPEALLEATQRKQEAAMQLKAAQDRAALAAEAAGFDQSMGGYVTWALDHFEADKALTKRFNAMLDLMGRCAQANELARKIIDARLASTDQALRILLQGDVSPDPCYGEGGKLPRRGKGSSRGAA